MHTLKILDLFCGAGGAAMGLHQGLDDLNIPHTITGVDIEPQPRYPFTFVQGDALQPPFDLQGFDFIWASPPCQDYSTLRGLTSKQYPRLIEPIRDILKSSNKLYVIENVKGARYHLQNPLMLCGTMFNLRVQRHRYFECNPQILFAPFSCNHWGKTANTNGEMRLKAKQSGRALRKCQQSFEIAPFLTVAGNDYKLEDGKIAMGIDWMRRAELSESIPPAYSRYIIKQIFGVK